MRYADRLDPETLKRYAAALNSRARGRGVRGRVSAEALRTLILESGGRCAWCGASLVDRELEIDHIISLSGGGDNRPSNLAVSCPACNRRKSDRSTVVFAQELLASGGVMTPLLRRVLKHYGIDEVATQARLFNDAPPPASAPLVGEGDTGDDAPPADVPPYRWAMPDE